jgi:peptidyl-tRNA hydrolase
MTSPFPHVEAEPYYLYILMRNDLASLNPGKACAQAAHAANQFVFEARHKADHLIDGLVEWQGETGHGFGTTITLEMDIRTIRDVVRRMALIDDVHTGITHDPTYPVRDGEVTHLIPLDTCGYVFGPRDHVQGFLRSHSLMK